MVPQLARGCCWRVGSALETPCGERCGVLSLSLCTLGVIKCHVWWYQWASEVVCEHTSKQTERGMRVNIPCFQVFGASEASEACERRVDIRIFSSFSRAFAVG
jgi:hypothetical protein